MASLDSLPPDQRAVLQLVLQRGRSYDEIAQLLSIDRAAVRERALNALDALGPQTRVSPDRRALITDYLLGQLPPKVADDTRDRLADSASERAWGRVVASELASLATGTLPEIPAEGARGGTPAEPAAVAAAAPAAASAQEPKADAPKIPQDYGLRQPEQPGQPRSRTGGAILIGLGVLVVIAVVVVIIATSGSGKSHSTASSVASTPTTSSTPATSSTPTTTPTTSTSATPVAQFSLKSPTNSKTIGVVIVLKQDGKQGIAIRATNVPANSKHNAYAVWLYNSPSDAVLLGFVSPGVTSNGQLSTAGAIPSNAGHFKQMLVTLETQAKPKAPGTIVLQGNLKLH